MSLIVNRLVAHHPLCAAAAIIGSACGIASWLACAQIQNGAINITTTGLNPPLLTGNIFSVGISAILVVAISLIFPSKLFDWEVYKEKITTSEDTVRNSPSPPAHMPVLLETEGWVKNCHLECEPPAHR